MCPHLHTSPTTFANFQEFSAHRCWRHWVAWHFRTSTPIQRIGDFERRWQIPPACLQNTSWCAPIITSQTLLSPPSRTFRTYNQILDCSHGGYHCSLYHAVPPCHIISRQMHIRRISLAWSWRIRFDIYSNLGRCCIPPPSIIKPRPQPPAVLAGCKQS